MSKQKRPARRLWIGGAGILLLAAAALYCTRDVWSTRLATSLLHRSGIEFSSLERQGTLFVVEAPTLERDGIELRADQMSVQPHLLHRPHAEVHLIRPHLVLGERSSSSGGSLKGLSKQQVSFKKGVLELRGERSRFYEIDGVLGENSSLRLQSSKGHQLQVTQRGDVIRCSFHEISTEDLVALGEVLFPQCRDLEVLRSGEVSGRLLVNGSQLFGELQLADCHIRLSNRGLEVGCDEGSLLFDGGKTQLQIASGGRLVSKHASLPGWSAEELVGTLSLEKGLLGLQLEGQVTHDGAPFPLLIEGEMPLPGAESLDSLHMHVAWPGQDARVRVRGKRLLGDEQRISLHLEGLGRRETALLETLAGGLFPGLENASLSAELAEGKLFATVSHGQPTQLDLKSLKVKNLNFSFGSLSGSLGHATGDLSLRVTPDWHLREAMGSFEVERGELELRGDHVTHRVSHLSASGMLHRGRLVRGQVRAGLNGLQSEIAIESSKIVVGTHGPASALAALLPVPCDGEALSKERAAVDAELQLSEEAMRVMGSLELTGGATHSRLPFEMELGPSRGDHAPAWFGPLLSLVHKGPLWIEEGQFSARELSLAQCVAPFVDSPDLEQLSGIVDLEGQFRPGELQLNYSGRDIALETGSLQIHLDKVSDGEHRIDLTTLESRGGLTGSGGTYLAKELGVEFEKASGRVEFFPEGLRVENLQLGWQDLRAAGRLDWREGQLRLSADTVRGKGASARALLQEIAPLECWSWPIDGECDGELELVIEEEVSGRIGLQLTDGSWRLQEGAELQEASASILYEVGPDRLEILELDGALVVEDERTLVTAPEISLQDGTLTFELGGDDSWLKGSLSGDSLQLDEGSHLGGIRPRILEKEGERLVASPVIELATLKRDLGWLAAAGFNPPPIPDGQMEGRLQLEIEREGENLQLSGTGQALALGERQLGDLVLKASKEGTSWRIEQGSLGDLELKAHGTLGECVEVERGVLLHTDLLSSRFHGKIAGEQLALELDNCTVALPRLKGHRLEGFLQAKGEIRGSLTDPILKARVKAQDLAGEDVGFCARQPFWLELSRHGIDLERLDGWLVGGGHPIRAAADRLHVDPVSHDWRLDDLQFSLPARELRPLTDRLPLPAEFKEALASLKSDGDLVGRIHLSSEEQRLSFNATLQGDIYTIGGRPLDLQSFSCRFDGSDVEVRGSTQLMDQPWHLLGHWRGEEPDALTLYIDQKPPSLAGESIAAHFILREGEPVLQRLQGNIEGLGVDLKRHERPSGAPMHFTGRVNLEFPALQTLLPDSLAAACDKAKLGDTYTLLGEFEVPVDDPSGSHFDGTLSGEGALLGGYVWQHLHGRLTLSKESCDLRSLSITDPAGTIQIDQLLAWQVKPSVWQFACPSIVVTDFRPTSLRRADGTLPQPRTFTITHAELTDIRGNSSKPESWSGKGHLDFSNPPKRDLSGTLFALPEDLISSLGFDLGNFVPANGRVHYRLKGSKFQINRLENVYSRGQHSQFLLAKGDSLVGLDGQLDLRIKVRQYNLLLKPTELLSYKVRGNFSQPKISVEPKR